MHRLGTALLICSVGALVPTGVAEAEFTSKVFAAKFLCGFLTGDLPDLDQIPPLPRPYSVMGPGDYTTLVAAVNLGVGGGMQSVTTTLSLDGFPRVSLGSQVLAEFETAEMSCPVIVSAIEAELGLLLDGRLVQGYVVIETAGDSEFGVSGTYTYAARSTSQQGGLDQGRGLGSSVHVDSLEPRVVQIVGD